MLSQSTASSEQKIKSVQKSHDEQTKRVQKLEATVGELKVKVAGVSEVSNSKPPGDFRGPIRQSSSWSQSSNISANSTQARDPCWVVMFNLGQDHEELVAVEQRLRNALTDLGIQPSNVRTLSAFKNQMKLYMSNVLFSNVSEVSFAEIALQQKRLSYVPGKTVWLKVAEPRPPRSVSTMFEIAHQEVEALESDSFGTDAMSVTIKEDCHKIFLGDELACFVVSTGLIWSAFARRRYEAVCRQYIDCKVAP